MSLRDKIAAAREGREPVVLPLVNQWLEENQNHIWSDEAMVLAQNILRRRESTYPFTRNSPSSYNGCMRQSVILHKGHPRKKVDDYRTLKLFLNGNFGHLKWQMTMFEMGILHKAEVPVLIPGMEVAGTCDGILHVPKEGYDPRMTREDVLELVEDESNTLWSSLEIKNHNEYVWKNNKDAPAYKTDWQGKLYTHGLRKMAAIYHDYPMIDNVCFWIDNTNTSDIIEHFIEWDDAWIKMLKRYYNKVLHYSENDILPERGFEKSSSQCRFCPVKELCDEKFDNNDDTIETHPDAEYGNFTMDELVNNSEDEDGS